MLPACPTRSRSPQRANMALPGLALRRHYPQHYDYFGTRILPSTERLIRGHNRVLTQVNRADGIKTGYVRASGFNIVTSVSDNGRQLVAVVMGGNTAKTRDAQVVSLVNTNLPEFASR